MLEIFLHGLAMILRRIFSANKIKKILFRGVVGFVLLSFLGLFVCGIILKQGIAVESFTIGYVTISGLSLVWQQQLELQVDTIEYHQLPDAIDFSKINQIARVAHSFFPLYKIFSKFALNTIKSEDFIGTLQCSRNKDQKNFFSLSSEDINLRGKLNLVHDGLVVDLSSFSSKRYNSRASGQILLDFSRQKVTGDVLAYLGNSLPVTMTFIADSKKVTFQGTEAGEIATIKPFVDVFGLDDEIQRWITEYLVGTRYNLKTFRGEFPWGDPGAFLDNLYGEVRVDNCEYTFAPGLEPIKTKFTEVVFSQGVLAITPHFSTFYGQSGEDSWLDINFNDPENIILTAYIDTHVRANDDILRLLKYYDLILPLKQLEGKTGAELTLAVNLNQIEVEISGKLHMDEGVVEYNGKNFTVTNAYVTLHNGEIGIDSIDITYNKLFDAKISGKISTGSGRGELDVVVSEVSLKLADSSLSLAAEKPKPRIAYHIRPEGHSFDAGPSTWKFGAVEITVGPFKGPFSYNELSADLPSTLLTSPDGFMATVGGSFSLENKFADLQGELLQYKYGNVQLDSYRLPFSILYDKQLVIRTDTKSRWKRKTTAISIDPFLISYDDNIFSMLETRLQFGNFFDGQVSGHYNFVEKDGGLAFRQLIIGNGTIHGNKAQLDLLLKRGEDEKQNYTFSATIPGVPPLLIDKNRPFELYQISGTADDQGFVATVNDMLHLDYADDQLSITSEAISYNVPAIVKFIREETAGFSPDDSQKIETRVTLEARNSSLYFTPNSQALADRINFDYSAGKSSSVLENGLGKIVLESVGDRFSLKGEKLNDTFMGALLQGAKFLGGQMGMVAKGSFDQFSVLMKIDDTILVEHNYLNNIMAFLNTVPALVTFSLPEYSTKGLPIHSAVAGVTFDSGTATFESIDIESPAFGITGTGTIDFPQQLIDVDLNLTTQAKDNLHKIPLIGYIMAGEEKHPSVTLKVSGNLFDPEVKNPIFQEVAAMPFSMLYRTLKLPIHLVESLIDFNNVNQDSKEKSDLLESEGSR